MTIIFNADEVFRIGVEIEKNGKAFYDAAAANAQDEEIKKLLAGLAEWESGHIALFENLRSRLASTPGGEPLDLDDTMGKYLKAAADSHVFGSDSDPAQLAAECPTALDVLMRALEFEKDSIVVYTSMRGLVPDKFGKHDIDRIIDEELDHICMLRTKINALK